MGFSKPGISIGEGFGALPTRFGRFADDVEHFEIFNSFDGRSTIAASFIVFFCLARFDRFAGNVEPFEIFDSFGGL